MGGVPDQNNVWIPTHEAAGETHLWALPPAVTDAALKELLKAHHKQTDTFHILLIPHLMTPRWRRLFNKACDFTFVISPGSSFWPVEMYKPLWVGIVLTFTKYRPWCFRRAPLLVEMGRSLRGLLETCETNAPDLLQKLLFLPRRVDSLSFRMACGVLLQFPYQLIFPFEGNNGVISLRFQDISPGGCGKAEHLKKKICGPKVFDFSGQIIFWSTFYKH